MQALVAVSDGFASKNIRREVEGMAWVSRATAVRGLHVSVARVMINTVATVSLCGCSSLYLHSPDTEKSTSAAKTALDGAKTADVFDRQATYLTQLQSEEIQAVVARNEAQRDHQVALFLTGNDSENGLKLLAEDIQNVSTFLYGGGDPDQDAAHPLWRRLELESRGHV